jgi:hypothetical protein
MTSWLNWVVVVILVGTSIGLLIHQNWRLGMGLLALQYLCAFLLIMPSWPLSMAAVKLVTGWMVCGILIISMNSLSYSTYKEEESLPKGRIFRLFPAGIVIISTYVLAWRTSNWLSISLPVAWSSLILVGMGLLQLGITTTPIRVVLGLLTAIAGFEILYSSVESSTLVAASLSVINLGLALTGSYLVSLQQERTV